MSKRFNRSDSITYKYITYNPNINAPEPGGLPLEENWVYLHASPEVSWKDIAREFENKRSAPESNSNRNPVLTTCVVEKPDLMVGLTLVGFTKLIENSARYGRTSWEEQVEMVSKELVALRDLSAYEASKPNVQKKLSDFWPE